MSLTESGAKPRPWLLIAGILLIAANLRVAVTALPPLLGQIQSAYQLDTLAAGALTTLPLLAFAVLSPFSVWFARRYGLERSLFGALAAMALGVALRSAGTVWYLYAGTGLIGMGIAVGNVLLPSLVKRDFPQQVAGLTGAYVLVMGVAAALGSALVVPMGQAWGWRPALAMLIVPCGLALAVWWAQLGARPAHARDAAALSLGGPVWRSPLAWQVTLFMGLNSTIYYVAIGWLPTILAGAGLSAAHAGSLHGVLQLASAVPGLMMGPVVRRFADQRAVAAGVALCSAVALLGYALAPAWALLWSVLFGFGTGAGIVLGLSFIALRSSNARQAASLSGMSQCLGYLLAAGGPLLVGALHDRVHGWTAPLLLCAALAMVGAVMGLLAGRNRQIGA